MVHYLQAPSRVYDSCSPDGSRSTHMAWWIQLKLNGMSHAAALLFSCLCNQRDLSSQESDTVALAVQPGRADDGGNTTVKMGCGPGNVD